MEYPYDIDPFFPLSISSQPIKRDTYKVIAIDELGVDELFAFFNSNKYHTAQLNYAKGLYDIVVAMYNGYKLDEKECRTKLTELYNNIPEDLRWIL